jgi:hypothetical protein
MASQKIVKSNKATCAFSDESDDSDYEWKPICIICGIDLYPNSPDQVCGRYICNNKFIFLDNSDTENIIDTSSEKVNTSSEKVDTSSEKVNTSFKKVDTSSEKVDTSSKKVDKYKKRKLENGDEIYKNFNSLVNRCCECNADMGPLNFGQYCNGSVCENILEYNSIKRTKL